MPASIRAINNDVQARALTNREDVLATGPMSPQLTRTLHTLARRLPQTTTLFVVASHEQDFYYAHAKDSDGRYPLGEVFTLTDTGAIGKGDVNVPHLYDTVGEFAVAIEAVIAARQAREAQPGFGIPYARVDETTGQRSCPKCGQSISEDYDAAGEPTTNHYAVHYEEQHGALRWGADLPADIIAALKSAGVVTTSAQRAYREARHQGHPHERALETALAFTAAEAQSMGLSDDEV